MVFTKFAIGSLVIKASIILIGNFLVELFPITSKINIPLKIIYMSFLHAISELGHHAVVHASQHPKETLETASAIGTSTCTTIIAHTPSILVGGGAGIIGGTIGAVIGKSIDEENGALVGGIVGGAIAGVVSGNMVQGPSGGVAGGMAGAITGGLTSHAIDNLPQSAFN